MLPKPNIENQKRFEHKIACEACGLHRRCKSPKMPYFGEGKKGILIIAEAPGREEDKAGRPLVGRAGKLVRSVFEEHQINIDSDCWRTNAVLCRPTTQDGSNRTPTSAEVLHCLPYLKQAIIDLKPKAIFLFGAIAVQAFLLTRDKIKKDLPGGINRWRGWNIPDQHFGAWVLPTYHPAYILRSAKEPVIEHLFKEDIKQGIERAGQPLPRLETESIQLVTDSELAIKKLEEVIEKAPFAVFDWETTGIRPYREGHKIVSAGIASRLGAFSFLIDMNNDKLVDTIRQFLVGNIRKGAHNAAFEVMWANHIFGVDVNNLFHDSMIAAHVLDNRGGSTSLNFQSYIMLGVDSYDQEVADFLKSNVKGETDQGSNSFNRIMELLTSQKGIFDLLKYNALDALYEYEIAKRQLKEILS